MLIMNILMQIFFFIGVIYLVGFIISLLNRAFYSLVNHSRAVCYATGFIGTPVHELSHAIMCFVFGHRIQEVKLFQIDDENGVLGYVRHSYNPRNLYHIMGNFFIGVAPIVCGTLVLFLLIRLLMPSAFTMVSAYMTAFTKYASSGLNWQNIRYLIGTFSGMTETIFSSISLGFPFFVFLVLALCIALHQNLSGADIKNSLTSLPILIILLVIVNVIIYLVSLNAYISFVGVMNRAGGFLTCGLLLALMCSCIPLVIALTIKGSVKIFKRK